MKPPRHKVGSDHTPTGCHIIKILSAAKPS